MEYLAVYLRLSIEDQEENDESNSISNQRKQIFEYIHQNPEFNQYDVMEFCDDGYSGTTMERPDMQKMLREIMGNQIKCIIVKDMSRFSRDYIEMGTYLNQIFPFMGIRFIALNDHYDSKNSSNVEIDTVFQTLLYDLYSKDISAKVKASTANKCANGEYVFGQVPFGYEKNKQMKNAVVVNEKEAEIVRYIFSLAVQGRSSTQIARQLHEENVPTIQRIRMPDKDYRDGKIHSWSTAAIRRILNNRFYLGEMAYGKTMRKSVGSKSGIHVPMEDWKVIRNHHEALISEEVYEQVAIFRPEHSTKRMHDKHPLTGKLCCGGCGYALNYKPIRGKNKYRRFECGKHALLKIPDCCTYMNATLLEETVLFMLNKELMLRGNAVKQQQNLASFQKTNISSIKKKQEGYRSEIKQAMARKDMLYEVYALGDMTREEYKNRVRELSEQISSLSKDLNDMASRLAVLESEYQKLEEDMKQVIRYSHIEALTQQVVDAFVRKIYVYKNKRVEVEWNFSMDCGVG